MWRCLLNIFLFTVIVHTMEIEKFKHDLKGFKELVGEGNDKIGNLTPNTSSINLQDLSQMVNALKPLEGLSRSKRQAESVEDESDNQALKESKNEVNAVTKSITMPLGGKGTSAFTVHATTVYILYPSLFQDPNIFGRFSIPQNIRMNNDPTQNQIQMPRKNMQAPAVMQGQPQRGAFGGHKGKRSADPAPDPEPSPSPEPTPTAAAAEPPKPPAEALERKVVTDMRGTIVVQNQDVNEYNRRDSY